MLGFFPQVKNLLRGAVLSLLCISDRKVYRALFIKALMYKQDEKCYVGLVYAIRKKNLSSLYFLWAHPLQGEKKECIL